jgi:hypothetical protein
MVVAPPSAKPGVGKYRWLNKNKIANAPAWLIGLCLCSNKDNGRRRKPKKELMATDLDELTAAVDAIPNDFPEYDGWKQFGMAIFAATDGDDYGFELFDSFSRRWTCGEYDEAATRKAWREIDSTPPNRIGFRTIYFLAYKANANWRNLHEAKVWKQLTTAMMMRKRQSHQHSPKRR